MIAVLFVIIIIGFILEIVSLKRDPDKIELDCAISSPVTEPGAPFKVQTIITNKSLMPFSYLSVKEVFPPVAEVPGDMTSIEKKDGKYTTKVCRIKGHQRKKLTLETSIEKRGVHSFKGDSVEFGDFLGFREYSRKLFYRREIVVYPGKFESPGITEALGRFCGDVASKRYLIRDPILTVGCREYTGREPMKEIHWLASAHRGELMVREFDYNRQLSVSVIMSVEGTSPWDEEELDESCAVARTVCEALVRAGAAVNFYTNARLKRTNDKEVWKCAVSSDHMGALLEGLGRASSYACGSLDKLLKYALHESNFDSAFIVILPENDTRGGEAIHLLRSNTGQDAMLIHTNTLRWGNTKRAEEETA